MRVYIECNMFLYVGGGRKRRMIKRVMCSFFCLVFVYLSVVCPYVHVYDSIDINVYNYEAVERKESAGVYGGEGV